MRPLTPVIWMESIRAGAGPVAQPSAEDHPLLARSSEVHDFRERVLVLEAAQHAP